MNKYLSIHKLYPKLQSACRKHHSTETTLLKVINDILVNMNSQHVSLLVLLDLSAAFHSIDHSLLLDCLKYKLGVNGTALAWFSPYLTNRICLELRCCSGFLSWSTAFYHLRKRNVLCNWKSFTKLTWVCR